MCLDYPDRRLKKCQIPCWNNSHFVGFSAIIAQVICFQTILMEEMQALVICNITVWNENEALFIERSNFIVMILI